MPEIVQLLVSPIHRFEGRPADGPLPAPPGELVEMIQIREGLGVVGDRYFGKPAHREASISVGAGAPPPASALARLLVIAQESLPPRADLTQVRRNILVSGIDVDALIGSVLTLDSGTGPVRFALAPTREPLRLDRHRGWPGTRKALQHKGGARCVPLNDGVLRLGPVLATITSGSS